jgi:predicted nucleic acid-binding protein
MVRGASVRAETVGVVDDLVLATAVGAKATTIVNGDDDLLVLRSYSGIKICTPRRFLEQLDAESS